MFFNSLFDYPQTQVFVISDSHYAEMQQKQLEQELIALQSRANRYRVAAEELDKSIEIKQEAIAKLLPATKDEAKVG